MCILLTWRCTSKGSSAATAGLESTLHRAIPTKNNQHVDSRSHGGSNLPLWTLPPQCSAATPHVADLCLSTCLARAVRALDARLALEGIELRDQIDVRFHSLGHGMPVGGIEWSFGWPIDIICLAGRVFQLVSRASRGRVEIRKARNIRVPGVRFIDIEGSSIDLVHAETAVQIGKRRNTWSNPANVECVRRGYVTSVIGIVYHELVLMSMAEEDVGDDVWRIAINDLIEQICGVWQTVGAIPSSQYVTDDPDSFTCIFCSLQFFDYKGLHPGDIRVAHVVVVQYI